MWGSKVSKIERRIEIERKVNMLAERGAGRATREREATEGRGPGEKCVRHGGCSLLGYCARWVAAGGT